MTSIVHIVYSGVAGSPRGALYLAEREKEVGNPYVIFIGQTPPSKDYEAWAEKSGLRYTFIEKRPGIDLLFFTRIDKELRKARPDVLFVHGTVNLWFALPYMLRKRGLKKVVVEHGPGIHLEKLPASIAGRVTNHLANCLVFVSQDVNDYWNNKYHKYPKIYEVIANGTEISEFEGKAAKKQPPVILMVAVMSEQKDHVTLVRAFSELVKRKVSCQLVLLGDGPKRKEIEDEAAKLGAKVTFIDPPPRKTVVETFLSATIYVLSTKGEGLSRSLLEAMSAKLPVIATDVSGNSGFIQNGENGLLVPMGDAIAMANAIEKLLLDKELREKLAENGHNYVVKHHSIDTTCKKYVELIKKLIND